MVAVVVTVFVALLAAATIHGVPIKSQQKIAENEEPLPAHGGILAVKVHPNMPSMPKATMLRVKKRSAAGTIVAAAEDEEEHHPDTLTEEQADQIIDLAVQLGECKALLEQTFTMLERHHQQKKVNEDAAEHLFMNVFSADGTTMGGGLFEQSLKACAEVTTMGARRNNTVGGVYAAMMDRLVEQFFDTAMAFRLRVFALPAMPIPEGHPKLQEIVLPREMWG